MGHGGGMADVSAAGPQRRPLALRRGVAALQWRASKGSRPTSTCWEPVARSCWSVRETRATGVRADWADPDPDPAPVTTIAWRLWHVAVDCLDSYSARVFGRTGTDFVDQAFTLDVEEALAATEAAGAAFRAGLGRAGPGDALRPARSDVGSVPRLDVPRAHAARARRGHPPQRRDRAAPRSLPSTRASSDGR